MAAPEAPDTCHLVGRAVAYSNYSVVERMTALGDLLAQGRLRRPVARPSGRAASVEAVSAISFHA